MNDKSDKPPFDEFHESAMRAVENVMGGDDGYDPQIIDLMKDQGRDFDFPSSGIDSLDMLDIVFAVDRELGVRVGVEEALLNSPPKVTVGLLYDHTRYRE
ncbi:hypothetical protein HYW59_02570 [Candidatus Kaiserbacteria bacterium]|nr:hypothetical protein [Candidatus Kaiserbacteria bacterium]